MNRIFKEESLISLDLLQQKTTRIFALLSSALMLFQFKVRTSYSTNIEKWAGMILPICNKIADKLEMKLGFESQGDNLNVFYLERKIS